MSDRILILDFGSQYTQLIARRVRELKVYCEIEPYNVDAQRIREFDPAGLILSGGPASVAAMGAPLPDGAVLQLGLPTLGICYGMQYMAEALGGKVGPAEGREYGGASVSVTPGSRLFKGMDPAEPIEVWMSHGDHVVEAPAGFNVIASTGNAPVAAIEDVDRKMFGVQFHPEVAHTPRGMEILENFVLDECEAQPVWTPSAFVQQTVDAIKAQVGDRQVVCGLSGGVDSSVAAVLIHRAIGDRLTCIFVDNGLLRRSERDDVVHMFKDHLRIQMVAVDARDQFLSALQGVTDPERKRKIIGHEFINVFDEEAARLDDVGFLAQGTLYPDVIESVSAWGGPTATIKSHHNVGGLPERMKLELVEPLRWLFKDEVRRMGEELGLAPRLLYRHPFPGPGLAVRCLGEITVERLEALRHADAIFQEEIQRVPGLYDSLWQAFCVLLPVRSVGVMGDARTYDEAIAVRAVHSTDGMTADWAHLPYEVLGRTSSRVINEVRGVNRVVYDVSSKPPATIEWE